MLKGGHYEISLGQPIFTLGCNRFSGNCRQYAVLLWHISHENSDRGNKTFLGIMAPIIYGVILAYILSR